jgi:hypothetical protein
MTKKQYDFSGIGTAYEIRCDDDRIIKKGTFDYQDGETVPFVWRHGHDSMDNILGHSVLKKVDNPPGMRVFTFFNDTENGAKAKKLVRNGDLKYLSVWANKLKEHVVNGARHVSHGKIREVSLVIGGQNPGAKIDEVIVHGHGGFEEIEEDGGIIYSGFEIELATPEDITHASEVEEVEEVVEVEEVEEVEEVVEVESSLEHEATEDEETVRDILNTFNDDQKRLLYLVLAHEAGAFEDDFEFETDSKDGGSDVKVDDLKDVLDSLSEKQLLVLETVMADFKVESAKIKHSVGDEQHMTTNIFNPDSEAEEAVLSHDAINGILSGAITGRKESLKNEFIAHGITNIENLFPESQLVGNKSPDFLKDEDGWVGVVMDGVKKQPFARIRTHHADITAEEARARGYITGDQKIEQVFPVFRRSTTPQTVYKLQKLDRDDVIDITDFDVVIWMKTEMRMMLREEIARAILVGDGRSAADPSRINPDHIRPVWGDDPLYTMVHTVPETATMLERIDAVVRAQIDYKGSGNLTFFGSPQLIVEMLLIRDMNDRRVYETESALADAMGVNKIVRVPAMKELVREDTGTEYQLLGVILDLRDYSLGADKLGHLTFFEDFDIDYNKHAYLYESRQSGALTRPHCAIVIELELVGGGE